MKKIILMIAVAISLLLIGTLIAVETKAIYPDKTIQLTSDEKTALATRNLTEYNIEDSSVTINGEARTMRCLVKSNFKRCFNVVNGKLKSNEILTQLDITETKVIKEEADNIIKQTTTQTKIGEGKTIIR
jgi:hypothetical protein